MTRYFAQNTPRAGLEHMMMSVPGFQKRGGGMMILSRFCYKPEDVDCRYCLHYRRRSCQVRTCPYIAERLKSGAIEYLDLILEYFGHIPHAGLHKRIQAVEHWSGPDQAVLHTVSVHLRSRFADRVWDDAPPGYLAALYLLASKERLWQPALPALSHDSIDFSRIVSKPHGFAIQDYGYQIAVLDLRNPTRSDGNNLLHLINKYMDIYKADPKNLAAKAKAEKYSKILAKTLINTSGGDSAQYGQNAFFYDSAEGLLTAMFLLVAEYLPTEDADGNPIEKRHIVSVFKLVQELLAPSRVKGKNQFQLLLEKLPPNHKARWFAGSALNTAEQAMASVISTVLSRLNAFLDSEMEQILCFDTAIDAEKFCNEKSAIFIVLPEEDQTKYFMVSLILQNLYREILTVADENGGRLKNRVVFFADELGTCPPIQSLELMFSASRSRGLMLVPIVQSITGQLQKNYGKEGSEIIVDNCQVNLYGGFAPASQTAVELSKSLGSRTVMSGSISRGKNDPSQSLQMMERPLMTPDELKSMPKGSFIVAKTGVHPMKVKLRLFLDWGIRFGMPYEVPEKAQRFVAYADKQELEESIIRRHYGTIVMDSEQPQGGGTSAGGMAQGIQAAPDSRKTVFRP